MIYSSSAAFLSKLPILGASSSSDSSVVFLFFCCYCVFFLAIAIPTYAGLYKIFVKAGQPGWHAFVPILNTIVVAHIVGRDWWWGLVPYLNLVPFFELAKSFGKSAGYGIGLILLSPVFLAMLGFDKSEFIGERKDPLF